jgi:hypothetical protein
VCKGVLSCCHRVATQLQLTNISYRVKFEHITVDIMPDFTASNKIDGDKMQYVKCRMHRNVLSVNSSLVSRSNLTASKTTAFCAKENRI